MHSNNKHKKSYDFDALIQAYPKLNSFVFTSPLTKQKTIHFEKSDAVFHLNKAILIADYGLTDWRIPKGYLCPPIPGRADYIHHIHDLLKAENLADAVKGLDVGVGANAIYPILGAQIYNWNMVGSDSSTTAVDCAKQNISLTPLLLKKIDIRLQTNNANIFEGIIKSGEQFSFTMCNPPFFSSEEEATRTTKQKLKNLKKSGPAELNFGGQAHELWCNGGEALFIKRMIKQSQAFKNQVVWFTTLVSKQEHLSKLKKQLDKLKATHKTIAMTQGNKKSRILAWTFKSESEA
ncbi:23S rRNA (adenine(1618)-N(6))-methyltransferase RlmF [Formosa sediminum]|uniref:Ribosomal RNA large subunit methyltransferase F n=1 Tax=Formosa sediminum TaxID=2594004 RepID=A0A516GTK1_9FLAO|nr:23S rRNA (adenine(1618)-N(6))-methyltransferase RlmF [Formosa sediminum]QDO94864.1 23S rRNA (adenine(1618)-N(6))-methyltransferase RlmF [Formosa sediminum]